jgi:hypothetical protein
MIQETPMDQEPARTRRILTDIDPSAWEHPADRAALAAARRIPVFDYVLRTLFGIFGEKPIRLAFQANAVKVGPNQFPELWDHYLEVCQTMDVTVPYDLFVTQTPLVNAGAYGMDRPFIVLNSGALRLLSRDEITYLLGHEVGHILSGHVLYRTMIVLLMQLATLGFPVIGIAARVVLSRCSSGSARASCRPTAPACSRSRTRRRRCTRSCAWPAAVSMTRPTSTSSSSRPTSTATTATPPTWSSRC